MSCGDLSRDGPLADRPPPDAPIGFPLSGPKSVPDETHPSSQAPERLHRLQTVRKRQGVSLRTVARQTGTDIRHLRLQEQESVDIRVSDLWKWQKALEVPMIELIVEPESKLSNPVLGRAQMVRLMKTAAAIQELAETPRLQRMAQMLVEQLVEMMPELKDVSPWHSYGQRRGLDELGRIAEEPFSVAPQKWDDAD